MTDDKNTGDKTIDEAPLTERQALDALMPWYAAGTLSQADAARLEAAMAADPSLAASLDAAYADLGDVSADNEARARPRPDGLVALMTRIEAEAPRRPMAQSTASLLERLGAMIGGLAPRSLGYAALAAAVVIALQAGLAVRLWTLSPTDRASYETASAPSGKQAAGGAQALMHFSDSAPMELVARFLRENEVTILDGPKAGGLFRVKIAPDPLEGDALQQRITALAARSDIIRSIAPAPPD